MVTISEGMTDAQMLGLIQQSLPNLEAAPIKHEVHAAVGSYWFALLKTNRNGIFHRFMCWAGDKKAVGGVSALAHAEKHLQEVLAKSPEHRMALDQLMQEQPGDFAIKDSLLSLMESSLKP
tara:strand:+ start:1182 stop:1544 length:363 start_codon:yes stop_codon:yes gene_type:complete